MHSGSRTSSWYLEQGEHISKELTQGEIILIQTSAIHLQFSWSGDAATPTKLYRIHVEYLSGTSGVVTDAQLVNVNKLKCDREETICLDRSLSVGRIVCRSGKHRVCLSIHKTPREAVP
jgi:hypothetical protein